jgi:hypothetical protein
VTTATSLAHEAVAPDARVAAEVLVPAHGTIEVAPAVWRAVRCHFADALHEIRTAAPFDTLLAGQWAVLVQLATAWVRGADDPSQIELAVQAGYCERTVRRVIRELEDAQVILSVRRAGSARGYQLGPKLKVFLQEFAVGRDAGTWTRGWLAQASSPATGCRSASAPTRPDERPAMDDATRPAVPAGQALSPAPGSGEQTPAPATGCTPATPRSDSFVRGPTPLDRLVIQNLQGARGATRSAAFAQERSAFRPAPTADDLEPSVPLINKEKLRSSSSLPREGTPPATRAPATGDTPGPSSPSAPRGPLPLDTLRAAACRALAARHERAFPGQPAPTSFSGIDVDQIVTVTAQGTWTEAELDQTHVDAIDGAWPKSNHTPPAVRFVWGKLEHFLQNARDGRVKRESATPKPRPAPKPREPQAPIATLEELQEIGRRGADLLSSPSPFESSRPRDTRFLPDSIV